MPRNFPDLNSLQMAAKCHHFRTIDKDESEDAYREALADHVAPIDFIESQEIRTGAGWDKWSNGQVRDAIIRVHLEKLRKQ